MKLIGDEDQVAKQIERLPVGTRIRVSAGMYGKSSLIVTLGEKTRTGNIRVSCNEWAKPQKLSAWQLAARILEVVDGPR